MEAHSWKDAGYRGFGPLIVALSLFLLAWIAVAALGGTLWTIGTGLVFALGIPISYYADARLKHRNLARFGYLFIVLLVNNILFALFYHPPPPDFFAWFMFGSASGWTLLIGISILMSERFLKPRLATKS